MHPAGGQSRPPLQSAVRRKRLVGADDSVGPEKYYEFAEDYRKNGAICAGRCGHRPLQIRKQACSGPSGGAEPRPYRDCAHFGVFRTLGLLHQRDFYFRYTKIRRIRLDAPVVNRK